MGRFLLASLIADLFPCAEHPSTGSQCHELVNQLDIDELHGETRSIQFAGITIANDFDSRSFKVCRPCS